MHTDDYDRMINASINEQPFTNYVELPLLDVRAASSAKAFNKTLSLLATETEHLNITDVRVVDFKGDSANTLILEVTGTLPTD